MADVLVIGAGLGGLGTAILLAQDGHDVTVVERDAAEPPDDPDQAWRSWERRGVNQFRLPHFLLARWRHDAERELPEVVDALLARGALRTGLAELPHAITGGVRAGDERFDVITARRPVIEAAFSATARSTYGLTVRRGVAVSRLVLGPPVATGIPHVVGIETDSGEVVRADLVVDTSGRRSPLPAWLEAAGARPLVEEREDSGFVYYGRHYRAGDGRIPELLAGVSQDYESVTILTLPADNGTWSTAFVTSASDAALRGLRDPARFDAALDLFPAAAHWCHGEAISGIDVMAGLEDRWRSLVVDGNPVATGIVAVADAWACTNPSLGRGASMALLHGCALRDLLREVPVDDPGKVALRWDEVTETTVSSYYRATVAYDRHRLAEIDAGVRREPFRPADELSVAVRNLRVAAPRDPAILRTYLRILMMLEPPHEVLSEPGLIPRLVEVAAGHPPYPLPGPDREVLVAAASAA